jgi:hypothetical protein
VQFDPALARLFLDRCRTSGAALAEPQPDETSLGARRRAPAPAEKPSADD